MCGLYGHVASRARTEVVPVHRVRTLLAYMWACEHDNDDNPNDNKGGQEWFVVVVCLHMVASYTLHSLDFLCTYVFIFAIL